MAEHQRSPGDADPAPRRWVPPPALAGFLLLLVVVFCLSYGVGSAAGPVAPGMHSGDADADPAPVGGAGGGSGRHGHDGTPDSRPGGGR
ncbi:hypothetical protein ACFXB4_29455 [Streptomyces lavendulae]|uniref:hypothetical protein n=1 Tax=Streptomyces lavendulae TaxID=1914 RepID=UPI003680E80A